MRSHEQACFYTCMPAAPRAPSRSPPPPPLSLRVRHRRRHRFPLRRLCPHLRMCGCMCACRHACMLDGWMDDGWMYRCKHNTVHTSHTHNRCSPSAPRSPRARGQHARLARPAVTPQPQSLSPAGRGEAGRFGRGCGLFQPACETRMLHMLLYAWVRSVSTSRQRGITRACQSYMCACLYVNITYHVYICIHIYIYIYIYIYI